MAENNRKRRARDIMSRDVVTLETTDTIHDALELMVSNRVSALPVVDKKNHCVGILSTTDLVDFTRDVDDELHQGDELDPASRRWLVDRLLKAIGEEPVGTYMTEDVATVNSETSLATIAQHMVRNRVHHIPVVDPHEKLVGIISTMDILTEVADEIEA